MSRIIEYAAIQYADGTIYKGSRHADCLKEAAETGKHDRLDRPVQGFLVWTLHSGFSTSLRFATREEARDIAISNNQVPADHGDLFSEDLWPHICPKCHGHSGFTITWVEKRTYHFSFEMIPDGESDDPHIVSGGNERRCRDCSQIITNFVKGLEDANTFSY